MKSVPLKHLATLHTKSQGSDPRPILSLDMIEGGTGLGTEDPWADVRSPPQSGVVDAEAGDVLFGKLRPYLAKVLRVTEPCYASSELMCLRPQEGIDSKWLAYRMLSRPVVEWAVATSEGTKMPRTRWENLGEFRVATPSVTQQRAIADYLDSETSRIDALIAKKLRLSHVVYERATREFGRAMASEGFSLPSALGWEAFNSLKIPDGWVVLSLGRVLRQLTNGYVGPTRDILREEGVKYVQSLHIKEGKIDFARKPYYVDLEWHENRPRINLRPGDILIVQTGDIGQVALVDEDLGPASCHALQIARPRLELVSSEYLFAYLSSPFGQASLLRMATGALHPHLEGSIRDVPVPVPPPGAQAEIAQATELAWRIGRAVRESLSTQARLLSEHRQALITAAVTGELEIPGVAV